MTTRVIDKVMDAADQLREHAVEAEKIGKLTEQTVKIMKSAGNIRLLQPKEHGGLEVHPREFAETVMATAALDPAAGWINGLSVCTPTSWPTPIRGWPPRSGPTTSTPGSPPVRAPGRRGTRRRWLHLQRPLAVQLRH